MNWQPEFFDRNLEENKDKPIFKNLNLEGFAIYLYVDDPFLLSSRVFNKEETKETDEKEFNDFCQRKMGLMFPKEATFIENCNYII